MNRPLALALVGAVLLGTLAWFLFSRGDGAPTPMAPPPVAPVAADSGPVRIDGGPGQASDAIARREAVPAPVAGTEDLDPEIRAALTGYRGRVVNHLLQPVPDTGVRLYRFSLDKVLGSADLMAAETQAPQLQAGETRTGADGTFLIEGVWPRAIFVLLAGIGSDAPTHRIVQKVPGPGEVVDLGDVVLQDGAVVTGIVIDDDGEPVPDALVRGADLPGQLVGLFPLERFDPKGFILVREKQAPFEVMAMPPWVEQVFEQLPFPRTTTDAEGRFRLVGLTPGSNLVATTKPGLLGDVRPSVLLRAGQVKDLGRIRLKRGEELIAVVRDEAGKPVAGAEVIAGPTVSVAPIDLASRVGTTDAEGKVRVNGYPNGRVTAAARRGPGQAWSLAEPQPILNEVVVTLPTVFALTVTVAGPDGKAIPKPDLKVYRGKDGDGLLEMAAFGFHPALDVAERTTNLEDGRIRITGLPGGRYTLLATAAGFAVNKTGVELAADAEARIDLPLRRQFTVRVVDELGKGIRLCEVFGNGVGGGRLADLPVSCGRTDAEGRLTVDRFHTDEVRVSAVHPRYGATHGTARQGAAETVLQMATPGALEVFVATAGRPAEVGKWTVAVMRRGGTRGAIEDMPQVLTPDKEGLCLLRGLQPGSYRIQLVDSVDALTSPGGVFAMMQNAFMSSDLPREQADVVSGQTSRVTIDTTPLVPEGPVGTVSGTVVVDGRPAEGYVVQGWAQGKNDSSRRLGTRVEPNGRFSLTNVPVGRVNLNISEADSLFGGRQSVWSTTFELGEGEMRELTVDLRTTSIEGYVADVAGAPLGRARVSLQGRVLGPDGKPGDHLWRMEQTDEQGRFAFRKLPEGDFTLTAEADGQKGTSGEVQARAAVPQVGIRIQTTTTLRVAGRCDLSVFGEKRPDWIYVSLVQVRVTQTAEGTRTDYDGIGGDGIDGDGNFDVQGVAPGTYRLQLHWHRERGNEGSTLPQELWHRDPVVVNADITGLQLVPVSRKDAGL